MHYVVLTFPRNSDTTVIDESADFFKSISVSVHYIIIHSLSIFFPVLFSLALSLFSVSVFLSVSPTLVIIGSNQDIQYPLLSHYIAELAKHS